MRCWRASISGWPPTCTTAICKASPPLACGSARQLCAWTGARSVPSASCSGACGSRCTGTDRLLREALPDTPVVVFSAFDSAELKRQALAAGPVAYLAKDCTTQRPRAIRLTR